MGLKREVKKVYIKLSVPPAMWAGRVEVLTEVLMINVKGKLLRGTNHWIERENV